MTYRLISWGPVVVVAGCLILETATISPYLPGKDVRVGRTTASQVFAVAAFSIRATQFKHSQNVVTDYWQAAVKYFEHLGWQASPLPETGPRTGVGSPTYETWFPETTTKMVRNSE